MNKQNKRKQFHNLISIEKARKIIKPHIKTQTQEIPIHQAAGHTTTTNIKSPIDVPPFDRAAMDGYAVKAKDTYGAEEDNPKQLTIKGEIKAGETPKQKIKTGETIEIATGAVMPAGANAVVMIEHTDQQNQKINIRKPVHPEQHVMHAGTDITTGEKIIPKNKTLTPREIGLLSATGHQTIKTKKPPKIAIISTGDEITTPPKKPKPGQIYDINQNTLYSAIKETGAKPQKYGVTPDNKQKIQKTLKKAAKENDIILTTGSTSAGQTDILYKILQNKLLFHGLKIKPGKPTFAAKHNNTLIIGLPGYPTSCLTIYKTLIEPIIHQKTGKTQNQNTITVQTTTKIPSVPGKKHLIPIGITKQKNKHKAYPVYQGSGAIKSLSNSEAIITAQPNEKYIQKGETKKAILHSKHLQIPKLLIMGSHCIGTDILTTNLKQTNKTIHTGSKGGLEMMTQNIPDAIGIHLLNKNQQYNKGYIKKHNIKNAQLIKGYKREQGIITQKNNPHNIKTITDLIDKNITITNRNQGSGTRKLLDQKIKQIAKKRNKTPKQIKNQIKGYNNTPTTHSAVAQAIKNKKTDAGIAIKPYATKHNLHFIKITEEQYDYIIKKTKQTQEIKKTIQSKKFKKQINQTPGLKTTKKTGQKIE
ncbi:Molybdopterin molybdenumtransferase fused to periplasmic molybdate-binding domain [Methanonatronarchaeum thermophilum]|uniref:Molybdopterin molybdenumtransferase fused to periplasmic molybdate-binding domain n=1 Tax=Methanonatronarchaeum thermophilum TaxID=1927129 RepID=A0A1Y3GAP0_9EURY|nr:molybdopterin biosynthesis protein [Methanonatronarchaeum thermophilum]OUJ18327.1 Molybdopterin molybdenumtransferase fused to periplasmic molybdate-binding domain [Methanonatronarchaeum thermophilum]